MLSVLSKSVVSTTSKSFWKPLPRWTKKNIISAQRYSTKSRFKAGQPIPETHPHLLRPGEITPGIKAEEYYARRARLLDEMPDNSMAIIAGNDTQFATPSVFYEFRQDPNFFYLTGFMEPQSALVLYKKKGNSPESIFFVPPKDEYAELWDGSRTGPKGAIEIFNADNAHSFNDIERVMEKLLKDISIVYYDALPPKESGRLPNFFRSYNRDVLSGSLGELLRRSSRKEIRSAVQLVEKSRLIKSPAEIENMRIAAEISADVYNSAYGIRFQTESQLYYYLDYQFRMRGCTESAYLPVVAGGNHALTIHYTKNYDVLKDGDLVLVDAAGRYGGYCADISRTWPVNGKFTAPQKDLYQAVLNVQKECIKYCSTSSGMTLNDIHRQSEQLFYSELKNCGFASLSRKELTTLYPHYIGHNLGIDVHDISSPPRFTPLQPGQIITIEPGVYVPDTEEWPKHFRGIGIRIEDDVVVRQSSYEVITSDTLKEIDDIEAAANSSK
ncbi:uncharacterized protein SAPINGB_P003348 [Magnusiomyces paraingens]|uniref:Aminopeptidase P N-terminal domain-containing protein n=1 Tax=Magnusiomyces paraingens TaxID=2606893 RepID=A0A5E8BR85_9ASCO|nr:uncharacterized protein SAPINGB_P003348 [Saprochaete ingens]VVT52989.1 unnamed protein product [Saprochaete ingens]